MTARPLLRRVAVWTLALAACAFVVWVVPFEDRCTDAGCEPGLRSVLARANVPLLLVLFAFYVSSTFLWAMRWRALLAVADVRVSLRAVWRVTLEAQAGGILLPGGVAGDALRIAFVRARAEGSGDGALARIIASVVVDRILGLATMATLAAAASLVFGAGAGSAGAYFQAVLAIPVVAALGWIVLVRVARAKPAWLERGSLGRVTGPIFAYVGAEGGGRALLRGAAASLALSGVQLVVVRGLVAALGVTPTREAWVYVGTTLASIVGALPLAPGALGTADAAYAFFLGRAGVPASVAVSVCMLYRIFWYGTGLIGGVLALTGRSRSASERGPK